jgi:hypothetical protein
MKANQIEAAKFIRDLSSADAANWLLEHYPVNEPNYGEAVIILGHRSWERSDQIRLAKCYLSNLPHASDRVYNALLSFMSVPVFLKALKENLPSCSSDVRLLRYYIIPSLRKAEKSMRDQKAIDDFIVIIENI